MAGGRCAGCGFENTSVKKVASHISMCEAYAKLYRDNPGAALDPKAEADRFQAFRRSDEGREAFEASQHAKWDVYKSEGEHRVATAQARWRGSSPGAARPVEMPLEGSVWGASPADLRARLENGDERQRVIAAASLQV